MLYKIARFFAYPIFRLLFGLESFGKENVPNNGKLIICANHLSNLDPLFLGLVIKNREIKYMAKVELFEIPVLRTFLKNIGAFPVNRGKADIASIKTALKILKSDDVLGIFPEGTRSKTGEMLEHKAGFAVFAYRCKSPVLPVRIKIIRRKLWFPKAIVLFGKLISYEELDFTDGSTTDIQRVSDNIIEILKSIPEKQA